MKKLIGRNTLTGLMFLSLIFMFSVSCDDISQRGNDRNSKYLEGDNKFNTDVNQGKVKAGAFIFYHTTGMVSNKAEIMVEFTRKVDMIEKNNPVIDQDVITVSPYIKGTVVYNGEHSLIFKPDEEMKRGDFYRFSVNLNMLYENIPDDMIYRFDLRIIPFNVSLSVNNIEPYSSGDKSNNFIDGELIGSDDLDVDDINDLIKATQDNNKLKITPLESDNKEILKFRIEGIKRLDKKSQVLIEWDATSLGSADKGELVKVVPQNSVFELTDIEVVNSPDQYIKLVFSDPVDRNINLDGIVYVVDKDFGKPDIRSNSIYIYTDNYQTGDVNVVIKKQLKNSAGKELAEDYLKEVHFGQLPPEVRFVDDGNIIAGGADSWQVHFQAVNLSKVDIIIYKILPQNVKQFLQVNDLNEDYQLNRVAKMVSKDEFVLIPDSKFNNNTWNTYSVDISNMIDDDRTGIYQVRIRFKKEYSLYECDDFYMEDDQSNSYSYYNYYESDYYYPPGYQWNQRDNPCSVSYYNSNRFIFKNILASDIGLSVKQNGDSSFVVFVNNLITSEPVSGADVSVYEYSQNIIASKETDSEGRAEFIKPGKSWLVIAQKGKNIAYLKIFNGNSLSYSRFETGGIIPSNGINAFIYGDRGVWRPGDTLFLTAIIEDVNDLLPDNHPVNLKLFNPRSKLVYEFTSNNGVNGFYTFAVPTDADDITGDWRGKFIVGNSVFYKRIKIENLKPNRLKIDLTYNNEMLLPEDNKGYLDVSWLHGGIAADLRTEINATLRPAVTEFEGYEDFVFTDVGKAFHVDEFVMLDKKLDNSGKLTFDVDMPYIYNAPGKLKVNTVTRVFEKSGDFSIVPGSVIFSPFEKYVGIEVPESDDGSDYLEVDKPHKFKVVVLNNNGEKVSCNSLTVEIFKISWSWWYSYHRNNSPGYIQASYNNRVFSKEISAKDGSAEFDFEIAYPMWGRYYVRVSDNSGKHSSGTVFYMDWPSWYSRKSRSNPGDAALLSLTTDKETYNIGDMVNVSFPSPENATAIVSLERNDRIIKTWNINTKIKETVAQFKVTEDMLPNIYVSISVIQSADNENDLPVRLYGVVPVEVKDKTTVLNPVIDVSEVVKPNSDYKIDISESDGKEMTYTVAVVDNGLLSLTNFATPDPYSTFFAKQALEVSTWDMYDMVSKSFKGNVMRTFAIGGGFAEEDDKVTKKDKANRFKPVVSFLGPFTLKKGEKQSHNLHMGNYIGSVRVMVIAGAHSAFGSADKSVTVKQDLMTVVSAPRKLCPGEQAVIPVTVFRMNDDIKKIDVQLIGNEGFDVENDKITLTGDKSETTAEFIVNVKEYEGIGRLFAKVWSGEHIAYDSIELNISNPNKREYNNDNYILKGGESVDTIPHYPGIPETRQISLTVSSMPQINLDSRLNYLIKYPYYCVEQVTSAAFPQLYLDQMVRLNDKKKKKVEKHIAAAIVRLSKMQDFSGGFKYWPESYKVSDWGTSYAGHFLIVAGEKGYSVSPSMMMKWVKYQKKVSGNWNAIYSDNGMINNDITQAYRLFTLALYNDPNTGAMNRMREMKGLHPQAKYLLASAYALIGQKSIGQKLIQNVTWETPNRDYWHNSYGSELRDKAIAAMSLYMLDDKNAGPLFIEVAKALRSSRWYSTQTTAFSLITMALFMDDADKDDAYSFEYIWNGNSSGNIIPDRPVYKEDLNIEGPNESLSVTNTSSANAFVTITTSGIPEMTNHPKKEENLKIDMRYYDMSGNQIDPGSVAQGTDFYAKVVVTNPGAYGYLKNLALSQLFPSGWEIMNTRVFDLGSELVSDKEIYSDYRDDRVDFFFDLKKGEHKKFVVLLNASFKGKYYLPVTQCSDMYNNNIKASSASRWINVK